MKAIQSIKFIAIFLICTATYKSYSQCDTSIANDDVIITITSIDASGCDGDPAFFTDLEASISIGGTVFEFGGVPNNTNTPVSGANEGCNGGNNTINLGPSTAGSSIVGTTIEIWEEDGCGACSYGTGTFCNDDADHDGPAMVNVDISQPTGSFSLPGSCFTYNYTVTCPPPPSCEANYTYSTQNICAGDPFTLIVDPATCNDPTTNPTSLDLDIYIYQPGGTPSQAPGGYDPLAGAGGVDNNFPISNTDLSLDGGLGGTWNGTICADYTSTATFPNNTCDPYTFSVVVMPWTRELDTDGDNTFGEYNNVNPAACPIQIYDITVYPAQPTLSVQAGTQTEGCSAETATITLELVAADGMVCDTRVEMEALSNLGCVANDEMYMYTYTKADIETALTAPPTPDCYADLTANHTISVYPNAANFGVTETAGDCGVAAMVEIAAENGDVCFNDAGGAAPTDPGCDNPDDVQDLNYAFDPAFPAACNMMFNGTVSAVCATTAMSSSPTFVCPQSVPLCDGAGVFDLIPMDGNNVAGAIGMFSGSATAYVTGSQNPGGGATIDLTTVPLGVPLTLEYTVTAPGCPSATTTTGCTFTVTNDCDADGGGFPTGP